MADRLKDIPTLDRNQANLGAVAAAVQEAIQILRGYRGDALDKAVTWRDLSDQGLVDLDAIAGNARGRAPGTLVLPPSPPAPVEPDLTPPPTATGLTVTPGISFLIIECDAPAYTQGHGHDRTVVYGAKWANPSIDPEPVFADAVPLCEFQGTVFAYATEPATTWCIWIKWKSVDGVLSSSPAGGTNGVQATTGLDVDLMVQAMTGPGNPFTILLVDTIIDGVLYPAGVYATSALIMDAQISRAKIKDLAVDNAKVADLSAAKLTTGSIAVGQEIQSTGFTSGSSGWRIKGDGTAEFSGVIVRGQVVATSGSFGGVTINGALTMNTSGHIKGGQTAYNTGTGFFLGYDGAAYKFSIGSSTQSLTWDGSALAITGSLSVGSSPAVSGTTMTGSGAAVNSAGTFALGNSTTNISFNGTVLTFNGEVVGGGNLKANAATLIGADSVVGRENRQISFTITSDDIPAGETTVPVLVTGGWHMGAAYAFGIGLNGTGTFNGVVANLFKANPGSSGVYSFTVKTDIGVGTHYFRVGFTNGAGQFNDDFTTPNGNVNDLSIVVQVCKR